MFTILLLLISSCIVGIVSCQTTDDRTPRISFWFGKHNMYNVDGVWTVDRTGRAPDTCTRHVYPSPDQCSLEYILPLALANCQKWWPDTTFANRQEIDPPERITFYNIDEVPAESIKDVYRCYDEDPVDDDPVDDDPVEDDPGYFPTPPPTPARVIPTASPSLTPVYKVSRSFSEPAIPLYTPTHIPLNTPTHIPLYTPTHVSLYTPTHIPHTDTPPLLFLLNNPLYTPCTS